MSGRTLRLSDADRHHLISGAAALGLTLDRNVVAQLTRFADLLDLWSPRVNLLSCSSGRELVERHLLDSLAVAAVLPDDGLVVDLGTGAGFPGVPLAVVKNDQPWVLVESRRRRVSFLREVRRTLGLLNVEIFEGRAEDPPASLANRAAGVVTRAVWSGETILDIAPRWLSSSGRLFWMRSDATPAAACSRGMRQANRARYQVGSGPMRSVEIFQMTTTE